MLKYILPKAAAKAVSDVVTALFNRAKARFLGKTYKATEIQIGYITKPLEHREDLSLPGIFDSAAKAEGVTNPNEKLRQSCIDIASQYFDAHLEATKAQVLNAVQSYLHESQTSGTVDPDKELKEALESVVEKAASNIKTVTENETTRGKNLGSIDAILRMAAVDGVQDPLIYFSGPSDSHTCNECLRMFFMPDRITPRVWRMSELSHAYHVRGADRPSICSGHPNCRHFIVSILPGYGFSGGSLKFIAPDYDILKDQRG